MLFGVFLVAVSAAGIFYGLKKKKWPLAIASMLLLAATIAVWVYFYQNPY
jgi:hypothetical protein